jgi:hypothetical protein
MSPEEVKAKIAEETRRLMAAGTPEIIAGILAASNIISQCEQLPDRKEVMATHCTEE